MQSDTFKIKFDYLLDDHVTWAKYSSLLSLFSHALYGDSNYFLRNK